MRAIIKSVLIDWQSGLTHGEIIGKHKITKEQEFAIVLCSDGLSVDQIEDRLKNVKPEMKSDQIREAMKK